MLAALLFLRMVLPFVIPVEYLLKLNVSMQYLEYNGSVSIKIKAMELTQHIRLDSIASVNDVRSTVDLEKWQKYSNHLSIYLKDPMMPQQEEEIVLFFTGRIPTNTTTGFYASIQKDVLAITQFETKGANAVFPCFDDPALKAYFTVQIAVEEPFYVIGNMDVEKIIRLDKTIYSFQRTPKLSTYLVAWAIGKPLYTSSDTIPNVRVFCARDCPEYEFGLMVTQGSLLYFENLLAFNYPNSKLDIYPVPDYTVEGMENFGLITIENKRFTINEKSSFDDRFYIATLIAHEVAHQWFGDIVTVATWSELWLNEGFAEYLQYHSVQGIFPETEGMFYINEFLLAFEADSSRFSHSIAGEEDFDDITYNKGAVVLSMISNYMDRSRFIRDRSNLCNALRFYLRHYAYSNVHTKSFLNTLGMEVSSYIHSWIFEPGFPIIYVSSKLVDNMHLITLKQKRFSLAKNLSSVAWNISVDLKLFERNQDGSFKSMKLMNVILDKYSLQFTIPLKYQFFINSKTTGLYYTHYGNNFKELVLDISRYRLFFDGIEKAHFIYQAFQLALSLRLAWADAIKSLDILRNESSPVVWKTVLKLWFKLEGILHHHWTLLIFKNAVRVHIPSLGSTWPDSSIMFLGVLSNVSAYVDVSQIIFSSWTCSMPMVVDPDYLDSIYYAAMQNQSNFELLWEGKSNYPGDFLKGLIFSQFPKHQERIFSFLLHNISLSDRILYSRHFVYYSPTAYKIIWKYIETDYPRIISKIPGTLIEAVVSKFAQNPQKLRQIQSLIAYESGSWEIPTANEPKFYIHVRKGIEKALEGIAFVHRL